MSDLSNCCQACCKRNGVINYRHLVLCTPCFGRRVACVQEGDHIIISYQSSDGKAEKIVIEKTVPHI